LTLLTDSYAVAFAMWQWMISKQWIAGASYWPVYDAIMTLGTTITLSLKDNERKDTEYRGTIGAQC
jgi:hypothetical protein